MNETNTCFIEQLPSGIIRVETKENLKITAEDFLENQTVFESILKGEKGAFLLVFAAGGKNSFKAMEMYNSPERNAMKKAEAFVLKNEEHFAQASFFLNHFEPKHPAKIFNNEEDAKYWLSIY